MRKKKWFIWIFIILILGAGVFVRISYLQVESGIENNSGTQAHLFDLKSTIEVQRGSLKKMVSASGFLQPVNSINLNLQSTGTAGGTVEETLVHNGEFVEEGQELVHLKDKEEKLNYLKAKNEYELTKINGSPSLTQEEKKLAMDLALEKLEAQTIKAPFSGKIVKIYVEEGDYIERTDDIIYLIDETAYEIEVSVSEVDYMEIEIDQLAEVKLDILDDNIFTGKVVEVVDYATAESNVVTVPVTIRMDEVSNLFKPGFSASAEIIVNSAKNTLLIPVTSLTSIERGSSSMVLKVEGDKAVPTPVKTGISDGYYREVLEGLQEGDKIIVNNYQMNTKVGSGNSPFGDGGGPPNMGAPMRMMQR